MTIARKNNSRQTGNSFLEAAEMSAGPSILLEAALAVTFPQSHRFKPVCTPERARNLAPGEAKRHPAIRFQGRPHAVGVRGIPPLARLDEATIGWDQIGRASRGFNGGWLSLAFNLTTPVCDWRRRLPSQIKRGVFS
jgi:hypothetical protein